MGIYKVNKEENRIYHREYNRKYPDKIKRYQNKLRLEVLTHYSGGPPKCVCCGCVEFRFLTLDHINGGGNQQRRELFGPSSRKEKGGLPFYRWLRVHGYPEGFQVMCADCNMVKGKEKKQFCPVHHPELYVRERFK
jgi:hypothetical protein